MTPRINSTAAISLGSPNGGHAQILRECALFTTAAYHWVRRFGAAESHIEDDGEAISADTPQFVNNWFPNWTRASIRVKHVVPTRQHVTASEEKTIGCGRRGVDGDSRNDAQRARAASGRRR